jgi:anti-anti-sigma regulatory factor
VANQQAKLALLTLLGAPRGCTKIVITVDHRDPIMVEFTSVKILDSAAAGAIADILVEVQPLERTR